MKNLNLAMNKSDMRLLVLALECYKHLSLSYKTENSDYMNSLIKDHVNQINNLILDINNNLAELEK